MARWLPAILLGLGACSFHSTAVPGPSDGVDAASTSDAAPADDGQPGGLDDIVNVRAPDELLGTADLNILTTATIDTTALTVSTGLPAGVTFTAALQDGSGADLAILHVLRFESAADLTVVGTRALVIIASEVSFSGALHADSAGVRGNLGAPGAGGGGAIEIYARTQLAISGSITVGSGGSIGSQAVAAQAQARGDGNGGEIVLQAPVVSNTGRLTATAGGGGGSAGGGDNPGRIVLLYRTRVDPGITSPTAETTPY